MRLLPSGERALLVELSDLDEVLALAEAVRGLAGIEDVVPGERTLLVTVAVPGDLEPVRRALPEMTGASVSVVAGARASRSASCTTGRTWRTSRRRRG